MTLCCAVYVGLLVCGCISSLSFSDLVGSISDSSAAVLFLQAIVSGISPFTFYNVSGQITYEDGRTSEKVMSGTTAYTSEFVTPATLHELYDVPQGWTNPDGGAASNSSQVSVAVCGTTTHSHMCSEWC